MNKEIKIDSKTMTAQINLTDDKLYIIKDGNVTQVNPPADGFGEQLIQWQHGKVNFIKTTTVQKI